MDRDYVNPCRGGARSKRIRIVKQGGHPMRVALVHDWLPVFSGAERVLSEIMRVVGASDLYTLYDFLDDLERAAIGASRIYTSGLNGLPFVEKYYRWTFPFCPQAIEAFNLSRYDLVVSSSAAFAKGIIPHPHQKHIAYVHTAVRYAWDQSYEYLSQTPMSRFPAGAVLHRLLHKMRMWDARTAHSADLFVANSSIVKRRIEQIYGRRAVVIEPPVDVAEIPLLEQKDDYFVVASRLVPYKRIDLVVRAFSEMPSLRLLVVGDGPEMSRLRSLAGANVAFTGYLPRAALIEAIQKARAFVFAACEDFGIVLAEAQAAGTPVVAFERGGAADIVTPLHAEKPTGVLFAEQSVDAVKSAVELFCREERRISPAVCRNGVERFAPESFRKRFRAVMEDVMRPDFSRWVEALPPARPPPLLRAAAGAR
jgi:glycosyltransferase involved in cell wall biosynthesis